MIIESGNYIVVACRAVGIGEWAFYNWIKRGGKGEKLYSQFSQSIKKAIAKTENYRNLRNAIKKPKQGKNC